MMHDVLRRAAVLENLSWDGCVNRESSYMLMNGNDYFSAQTTDAIRLHLVHL